MTDGPVTGRCDLSVVIPCHDVVATLGAQLDALLAQSWDAPWEIVVVDNRSTDGTAELAREYQRTDRRVRIVEAPERAGLCHARAVGIAAATADAIAICDGDDIVGSGWVAIMGEALRDHAVVTGPLEVDRLNARWLTETRGRPASDAPGTWFGSFPLVSGGNLGLRRDLWQTVGPFDETFIGAEDAEWSLRLATAGIPVHFEPNAVLHYRYRSEASVLWRQGNRYGFARPHLRARVAAAGLPVPSRWAGWRSWIWLLTQLPGLRARRGRARWAWVAGVRIGHVRGSLDARTLFL
ncbi:MAG TPA: glycosyltransferase [Acidimicrobiia bacterium]|nr:glycosyltransferase [Acidimicrobiia bacterium]